MKKRRFFIALFFPEEIERKISRLMKKLEKKGWPVRWEKPEKMHITLVFLGWVEEKKLIKIIKNIKIIEGIKLKISGLGFFPEKGKLRVIWLGLKGDLAGLGKWQRQVADELKKAGFEFEKRKFTAHITIGRVKREAGAGVVREMRRQLLAIREIGEIGEIGEFEAREVWLVESKLRRSGAEYKKIKNLRQKLRI